MLIRFGACRAQALGYSGVLIALQALLSWQRHGARKALTEGITPLAVGRFEKNWNPDFGFSDAGEYRSLIGGMLSSGFGQQSFSAACVRVLAQIEFQQ